MTSRVQVKRAYGTFRPGPDAYAVVLDGVLIGRVRKTDGRGSRIEWTAAVWLLGPPNYSIRSLEPIEGNFRFRQTAVEAIEDAWYDDNYLRAI